MRNQRIAVVTDSTACLSLEIIKMYQPTLTVVPLTVFLDGKTYLDGTLTQEEFFQKLRVSRSAKTSAPITQSFIETYETAIKLGRKSIISVHVSTWASPGTETSAKVAIEEVRRNNSHVNISFWNSQFVSMALGWQAIVAANLADQGADVDHILEALSDLRARTRLIVVLDTLEYLRRGGRIGKAQTLLGSILSIKPILTLDQGEILPLARERTLPKAFKKMVEIADSWGPLEQVAVSSGDTLKREEELVKLLTEREIFSGEIQRVSISSVIGVHGGPGLVGILAVKKRN